jgi:signal transduction histidine kinase
MISGRRACSSHRDAAEAVNRVKSTFLANMSHERRTPLNAIIGYSEMLQEEAPDRGHDRYIADLKQINSAGTHCLDLINDRPGLSKIEAGKTALYVDRGREHVPARVPQTAGCCATCWRAGVSVCGKQ